MEGDIMGNPVGGQDAGPGRGRGPWNAKGVQAAQSGDIEQLKTLVADMATRLDALEAGEDVPTDPGTPVDPVPVDPEPPVEPGEPGTEEPTPPEPQGKAR
jgi:hypothetical protein